MTAEFYWLVATAGLILSGIVWVAWITRPRLDNKTSFMDLMDKMKGTPKMDMFMLLPNGAWINPRSIIMINAKMEGSLGSGRPHHALVHTQDGILRCDFDDAVVRDQWIIDFVSKCNAG